MKNLHKISVNLIEILIYFLILEAVSFYIIFFKYREGIDLYLKNNCPIFSLIIPEKFRADKRSQIYREPQIYEGTKKHSIILFGCSFAYGEGLEDSQTFAYKLSKMTKRSVYNRAEGGMGPQIMLYQLQKENLKQIIPDCDYIIYIYVNDHVERNKKFRNWPLLYKTGIRYKIKHDKLKLQTISPPLSYSFVYRIIEGRDDYRYFINKKYLNGKLKYGDYLFYKVIEESNKLSKELYPKSEFIIFNYSDKPITAQEEIEKLGIKIISLSDLTNQDMTLLKYRISDWDEHPNEQAWNLLTPIFIKKANIT